MSHEYGPDGSIVVHHDRCAWTAMHGKEAPSPEPWDRSWTFLCCCDVIQGVEQRVSSEFLTPMALAFTGMSDPRYAKGYADGLDAAREAVGSMVIETVGNSAATVEQAVSVIDALREQA